MFPEYRKRGYGKALIQELRRRTEGPVKWAVQDWNEHSIRFYESLGAKRDADWRMFRWDPEPPSEVNPEE